MSRRSVLTLGTVVVLVLVLALVAVLGLLGPSTRFVSSLFAEGKPSTSAGRPVPAIEGRPDVRIAVAGDTGTGDAAERATVQRIVADGREDPHDALLLLGDLVYEDGDADLTDERVTEPFAPVTDAGAELLPVLGNHDYVSDDADEILAELGRPDPWYVEAVGPVRVVVLDSNLVDDEDQTAWLRDTLAEPQPPDTWTIVALHHPAYSAGEHGSDLDVRETWSPLFAEYDVPLVLAGHDHDYQRSRPQDGVTYVVSGGGAKLRPTGHEEFTAVSASVLHYLDLLFYDDRIVGRAVDQSGHLVDSFTIAR
jgi:3',5'-cyclic AMP phosphodiesterase CpdA